MKKSLIIAFVMVCTFAQAQTQQGKFLISGSTDLTATFSKTKFEYDGEELGSGRTTNIQLSVDWGYFFAENVALGISTGIDYTEDKESSQKQTTTAFGPFARLYVGSSKVKPYFQGMAGLASSKIKGGTNDTSLSGLAYDFGIGASIFLNEKVAIDGLLSYGGTSLKYSENSKAKLKMSGVSISFGFSLCL